MASARYNNVKGNQRNSDQTYEGEQGMAGMGENANTGKAVNRDNVKTFQKGDQTNPMVGDGSRQPQQAEYPQSRLSKQWR